GLVPSLPKSTAYFCNVLNHVKLSILQDLPFEEGKLPVKYLGVPLVSSRLMIRDCNELIDKVQIRIQDWKNKALSITVAWESVCLPKDEGGLGIRRLECFNAAIMASHIWKIISLKESLWVKWIHEYKLKGRNFCDFPLRGNMSWGWRKILQLRPTIRRFIWSKIGNGANTSLWFDRWTDLEPIGCFVAHRDMARAGLTPNSKVHDVIINGTWLWPHDLIAKFPVLNNYNVPINDEDVDRLVWRDIHAWDVSSSLGVVCSFCESNPDLHDHLFFECSVSCGIWNRVKGLAGLNASNPNIYDIIQDLLPPFHIIEPLDEFKNALGLIPSLPKSTAYFCNVLNHVKLSILQALPFEEGKLPVKYLGRLQLIQSVLGSMHIYWASLFILPTRTLLNIEQLLRQFLWCHGSLGKGKSKVAWESVCLPKDEGGLGIRRLECFNAAIMASHIWKIISLKESLWVKWIHEYKLKGRNFWDFPLREPIGCFVAHRDMARAGLTPNSKVHDVIINGTWLWPHDLIAKFPVLNNYNVPEDVDRLVWRDIHGNVKKNLVSQVWDDIRFCDSKVNWYSMVWFPSCIPRHAINLWLIVRRKLKTQDLIPTWDVSSSLGVVCSVKGLAGLNASNPNIYVIIQDLLPVVKHRTTVSVIAKLVVAASAYYVWQERNWRLFKKGKRSSDQIVECIVSSVHLKLLSCKLKKSKSGERMAMLWDLPEVIFT
nr:hypothetical protein [Tanacetum cinerariifolium]